MKRCALDGAPSREEALTGPAESWPLAICNYLSFSLTPEGLADQTSEGKLIKLSMSVSR
jgi:hypothetical protein